MDQDLNQPNDNNQNPGQTQAPAQEPQTAMPEPQAPTPSAQVPSETPVPSVPAMETAPPPQGKQISATVTCPHCGQQHEVNVEVPESEETPKMTWAG